MSKTTPEEAKTIADKHGVCLQPFQVHRFERLAAHIVKVPDELGKLADDETVWMRWPNRAGGTTEGHVSAKYCRETFEAIIKRQAHGFFTINEAALVLADTAPDGDAKIIENKILASGIPIRDPGDLLKIIDGGRIRASFHVVKTSELDAWLIAEQAPYCWPMTEEDTAQPQAAPVAEVRTSLKKCVADAKETSGAYWKAYAESLAEDFDALTTQYLALKNVAPVELPVVGDSDRLEFVIADECQIWECNGRYAVHAVTEHHPITAEFNTPREAIDAAIAAGRKAS